MRQRGVPPDKCVLVGDSPTDAEAAQAAGTAVIAYANRPGKRETFAAYQPNAIVNDLSEIPALLAA